MQRGHIFKFRKSWFLKYYSVELVHGVRISKRICRRLAAVNDTYRRKSDVQSLADKILAPINAGAVTPESSMKVSDFIVNQYFPNAARNLRPSTMKGYRDIFRYHLSSRLGDVTLRDFRTVHGQRIIKSITNVGHSSLFRIKSLLSGVFTYARREGILDGVNPMIGVEVHGRPHRTKQPVYDIAEIDSMLRMLPEPAKTVIAVAAFTGLRASEIRGLQWADFDGESLQVRRSVWRRHVGPTKTSESEASIPVLPAIARALNEYRGRCKNPTSASYIFAGERRGVPLNLANLARRVIKPHIEKCLTCGKSWAEHKADHQFNLDPTLIWKGWHALRRGLASNLYGLGVQPKVIQAILRHSSVNTTMQIYVSTDQDASREAMKKITDLFYPFG